MMASPVNGDGWFEWRMTHFCQELKERKNFEIIPDFFQIDPAGAGDTGKEYWMGWVNMLRFSSPEHNFVQRVNFFYSLVISRREDFRPIANNSNPPIPKKYLATEIIPLPLQPHCEVEQR
ncbi:hypothetical protein [Chitinophaga caseinilytica]|uniref:Uncharacterized protein n=1 Tax=Chitinophaga caseinilytica TaxID=2267521 RepID=A0ABZ2ZB89_9BACT